MVSTTQPSVGVDWQKGVGKEKRHPGIFLKKRFKTTNSRGFQQKHLGFSTNKRIFFVYNVYKFPTRNTGPLVDGLTRCAFQVPPSQRLWSHLHHQRQNRRRWGGWMDVQDPWVGWLLEMLVEMCKDVGRFGCKKATGMVKK